MIKMMAMVSSMVTSSPRSDIRGHVPGFAAPLCNPGADRRFRLIRGPFVVTAMVLALCVGSPQLALAQEDLGWFLAGAATSLGVHEGGHLIADYAFDAEPGLQKVSFGPFPFFAITH